MKVLTKEQEQAHYDEVLKGGSIGGAIGLAVGLGGVMAASRRYPTVRGLTLPFKSFLVTSTGTFAAIINADRWSAAYQRKQDPMREYEGQTAKLQEEARRLESKYDSFMRWGREHRYKVVFGSWIAAMAWSLHMVNRDKYLSTSQKLVQARVYAQGLTVAVLMLTAVFEMSDAKKGSGRWETVLVVDPNDPEHKKLIEQRIHKEEYKGQDLWKDMVAQEEKRLQNRQVKQ